MEIKLCDTVSERGHILVRAILEDDRLKIAGSDTGEMVEEWFGCYEYEYFYFFNSENTQKIFSILSADVGQELLTIEKYFSGEKGCKRLKEFCSDYDITYTFDTWRS